MNVLLINPSLVAAEVHHYSKTLEKHRGIYPPLGLSYVAASLINNGHKVIIVDCDAVKDSWESINKAITEINPDIVGFYVMTWTFRQVKGLLSRIKSVKENIISVTGGPNVSSFPKETLDFSDFDFGIQGEGEDAILELINCIETKGDFSRIDGLIWRKEGQIIENQLRKYKDNLDDISFPSWQSLPIYSYSDVFTYNKHFATMIATRGCPFNCTFCDRKNRMGKAWRSRSPENIVKEIMLLKDNYGIKEFMFFDDNFILDKKWVYRLCDEIKSKDLDINWECRARVDMVDGELLKSMRKSGCYRIRYGMESADNEILKVLKKDITVEQIKESVKLTKQAGIEIFAYFMMGAPQETEATLRKTIDLALEIDADFTLFSKVILIVGSEIFEWAVDKGFIASDYWKDYLLGNETNPAPSFSTSDLPEKVIDKYISLANKKFYLRPHYIFKRLSSIKTFNQFKRQTLMASAFLK
ncbi:B12-binding domain-containing radical SAM protein [Candidatus Omnitrophota bacterium]